MLATMTNDHTITKHRQAMRSRHRHADGLPTANRERTNPDRRRTIVDQQTKERSPTTTLRPIHSPVRVDPKHASKPQPHPLPDKPGVAQSFEGRLHSIFGHRPLETCFIMFGFAVAVALVLVFGADLGTGWPFQYASTGFDIVSVIAGLGLAYLSWNAYQDLT